MPCPCLKGSVRPSLPRGINWCFNPANIDTIEVVIPVYNFDVSIAPIGLDNLMYAKIASSDGNPTRLEKCENLVIIMERNPGKKCTDVQRM
jgi:hypothetical protein